MKTLLLFRHGKSDWEADWDDDHDRPLARRGVKAAGLMGRVLAGIDQVPDAAFTSSARRAADTVELAAKAGDWTCPIETVPSLYEASAAGVVEFVRGRSDALGSVLLAGHEPTWSSVVAKLTGGASVKFPTAAIARIDFEVDGWNDVIEGGGTLVWLLPPRLLGRLGLAAHSKERR